MAKGDTSPSTYRTVSGIGHVGAYQVSGRPWMTGSQLEPSGTVTVEFPSVTKNFTVVSTKHWSGNVPSTLHTGSLAVYFGPDPGVTWDGTNIDQIAKNHYVMLDGPDDAYTFETKTDKVHITCLGFGDYSGGNPTEIGGVKGSFFIIAELTGIPTDSMYPLTGSGIDE